MKKILSLLLVCTALWACSSNEEYDNVPEPIITFITQYWPNPVIESYSHPSDGDYKMEIKDGPGLEFDADYRWTMIDGNGLELPQVFLFNELPGKLYEYLEGGEFLDQVFSIQRDSKTYELSLLNSDISYDIATATVRQTYND